MNRESIQQVKAVEGEAEQMHKPSRPHHTVSNKTAGMDSMDTASNTVNTDAWRVVDNTMGMHMV